MQEMEVNEFGLAYVVIPSEVFFNTELKSLDKSLFALIDSLSSNSFNYCWATNKELALYNQCSVSQISRGISRLESESFIYTESVKSKREGSVLRKIFINPEYPEIHYEAVKRMYQKFSDFKYADEE